MFRTKLREKIQRRRNLYCRDLIIRKDVVALKCFTAARPANIKLLYLKPKLVFICKLKSAPPPLCFHLIVRYELNYISSVNEHQVLHRRNTNNRKAATQICDTFKWNLAQTGRNQQVHRVRNDVLKH